MMLVKFDKEYLDELFHDAKCSDKKHRYQPQIVKRYIKCVQFLIKLQRIEDIFPFAGFNYEVLTGDKKGVSSIRINEQYRLEFVVTNDKTQEPVIIVCTITDITNHYK